MRSWIRLAAALFLLPVVSAFAAPPTEGRRFVLGFGEHFSSPTLTVSIAGPSGTTGTVAAPGGSFTAPFTIPAGGVSRIAVPSTLQVSGSNVVGDGLVVTASVPVSVQATSFGDPSFDGALVLPATALGTEYVVLSAPQSLSDAGIRSQFLVVASEDDTQVTITPSIATAAGAAGTPFMIALDALDAYQLQSAGLGQDLSGTRISADKPIAVFAGGSCLHVPMGGGGYCSHLVEQMPPIPSWGTRYFTLPLSTSAGGYTLRLAGSQDGTSLVVSPAAGGFPSSINSNQVLDVTLAAGQYHEILATAPILAIQYSRNVGAENAATPYTTLLPPVSAYKSRQTVTTPAIGTASHVLAAVIANDAGGCTLDGTSLSGTGTTAIGTSGFAAIQVAVSEGTHTLRCSRGFGALVYGSATYTSYGYPAALPEPSATDLNGDGRGDVLYRNVGTGQVFRFFANGVALTEGRIAYTEPNLAWSVVADADVNGDGVTDLVWRNSSTGQVYLMPFAGDGLPAGGSMVHTEPNADWTIVATPDLDGDGNADLLWWNAASGQVYAMLLGGSGIVRQGRVYTEPNTSWRIVAVGDFAGSGKRNQLLWRNASSGQVYLMTVGVTTSAFTVSGSLVYQEANTAWKIVAAADFNGDGRTDILWRNDSSGQVYMMLMNGGTISAQGSVHTEPNSDWKIVATGDLNGDRKADILWRNGSTGHLYLMLMNGLSIASQGVLYHEPNIEWRVLGGAEYAQ